MKIAVMTWFHHDKYGTVLQAAALCSVLRELGHTADVIQYFPKSGVYKIPPKTAKKELVREFRDTRKAERNPRTVTELAGDRFNAFREKNLTMTPYCATMTDLEQLNEYYDAFVCGSDLIWLPRYFDSHYYLDFVHDDSRKIAYAPSLLDEGGMDADVTRQMEKLIRRFRYLSVREATGRKILNSEFDIHTEEVADPVLLLTEEAWERLIPRVQESEGYREEISDEDAAKQETGGQNIDTEETEETENAEAAPAADEESGSSETTWTAGEESGSSETTWTAGEESGSGEATWAADEESGSSETTWTANEEAGSSETTWAAGEEAGSSETTWAAGEEAGSSETTPEVSEEPGNGEKEEEKSSEKDGRSYMLACLQGRNEIYWGTVAALARRLDMELKIIPIHKRDLKKEGCIQTPVGPEEYMNLLRGAAYICTDSYHMTALALLHQKPICCFERYTERNELGRNSRIRHILDIVGLLHRIYDSSAPVENYLAEIDWIPVNFKLDALRLKSRKFLEEALAGIGRETEPAALLSDVPKHVLEGYSLCCGCGACSAVCEQNAVHMELDENGFYRAAVAEDLCVRCGTCRTVCPYYGSPAGQKIARGRLLSYLDEEPELVEKSGAGGLSGRLARIFHQSGSIICGCSYNEEQKRAEHIMIGTDEETQQLDRLCGIKYLQSDFSGVWEELKTAEKPLMIIGTPCQIDAAKKLLGSREDILLVDFVCNGVPSANLYEKYIRYLQKKRGLFHRKPKKDAFERILHLDQCSMEACYECRFRDTSSADLRLGDLRNDFAGRRGPDGASLAIVITQKGDRMLGELMLSGYWEGLKKEDMAAYIAENRARNAIKPVFYDRLMASLADDSVSIQRVIGDYVRPLEKRRTRRIHEQMFYEVGREDTLKLTENRESKLMLGDSCPEEDKKEAASEDAAVK